MYNEYFGLRQAPFRITPDTALFYTGGSRGAVLDALVYAITSGEGIVKVVGEVGTGKTMLCRMLEERLPDNVQIAYLANPSLTPEDILHAVALELGLDLASDANRLQVMHRLQEALLARHASNQRVVVLVEEAQSMPVDTLEEIRLLSNLETKNEKLLQIVLFGQPELDENLAKAQIRQLRERITHSFALKPLARDEVKDYVAFRLRASGYRGRDAFTADAYRTMSRASEGLTRRVNIIADKAMLAAFADDTHDVSAKHVKSAIADSEFSARRARLDRPALFATGVGAVLLAAALGWYAGSRTSDVAAAAGTQAQREPPPAASERRVAGAAQLPQAPAQAPREPQAPSEDVSGVAELAAALPVPGTPATSPAEQVPGGAVSTVLASMPPAVASEPSPAPAHDERTASAKRAGAAAVAPAGSDALRRAPASTVNDVAALAPAVVEVPRGARDATRDVASSASSVEPLPAADDAARATAKIAVPPAEPDPATAPRVASAPVPAAGSAPLSGPAAPSGASGSRVDPTAQYEASRTASTAQDPARPTAGEQRRRGLLQQRLRRTREWLRDGPRKRYTIQLLATTADQGDRLEAFLGRREQEGQLEQTFVYQTRISARDWYGVVFGDFAGYTQAREVLRGLSQELQLQKPFVRNISDINALD